MKLQGNCLRMLLLGAVAAGVLQAQQHIKAAGPISGGAGSRNPSAVTPIPATVPPQLLPATESDSSVIRPVAQTTAQPGANNKKSEVMRQLELLYQQDGKEMPEMNTDIKPVPVDGSNPPAKSSAAGTNPAAAYNLRTQQPAAAQNTNPPAVAPATAPATAPKPRNPVTSFFKKLVPGNKDPKPSQAPAEYRPDVAPVPPGTAIQPVSPLQTNYQESVAAGLPILDSQPRLPFSNNVEGVPDALPQPLATLDVPPAPNEGAARSELPPLQAEPTNADVTPDDLLTPIGDNPITQAPDAAANPFTEMSEAEADKRLDVNPFTGLTLDEDAGSANGSKTSLAAPGKSEAATAATNAAAEDPFADELRKLGILPSNSTETPKLAPPSDTPTFDGIEDQATREKMKKIHERGSMKGLKGFCPVTLRDQRELVDAKPDFHSTFRGQKFHFADADAKLKFDEEPARYAPAAYGADVVALTRDKDVVEGTLDFAAWFKGRLYLFGTEESHDTFVANPSLYATPVGIE